MRRAIATLTLVAACARPDDRSIEGAIPQFVEAVERGDADRVVQMLDASTIERLRARAHEASDLAGGGVTLGPADVLAVGFEPAWMQVARVETTSRKGGDGTALVHGTDGATVQVKLRLERGRWKIVLPP